MLPQTPAASLILRFITKTPCQYAMDRYSCINRHYYSIDCPKMIYTPNSRCDDCITDVRRKPVQCLAMDCCR
ncbi:hypothetical protein LZ32DRAFT_91315 [Colletotrichum eremochloae]|nr:hypothetical protein LZ32DRAFT_91315 [Colletotrichum eremochloae]